MIYFISFGSNEKYERLSYDVIKSLSVSYKYSFYKIYTASDLPDWIREYAAEYPKGFGYWMWKPWIIKQTLDMLSLNDIVLYIDGRCGLANEMTSVTWLDKFIVDHRFDVGVWKMNHVEKYYSTQDLIKRFAFDNLTSLGETGQIAATFHAWRTNYRSITLVNRWLDFLSQERSLCRDEQSIIPNDPEFISNRHDQSVFSLLIKRMIANEELSGLVLNDSQIFGDNLLPHMKWHPS